MLSSGTAQSLPPGSCAFPTPLDRTPYVDLASRKQHIHDTRLPPIAMAESLRGNGLYDVHDALARLANNTALLDRALRRFGGDGDNEPPPPYYPPSTQSGTPTEPDIPNAGPADGPEAEAARQLEREFQLGLLHELSRPHEQFVAQSGALALRLAILRHSEKHPLLPFPEPDTETRLFLVRSELDEAGRIIRARWKEQRIWSGQWAQLPSHDSRWPHENAYEPAPPDSRRGKRRTRATEAAAAAVASRPYQQFMYQVAKERDLLLGHVADLDPPPLPNRKPFLLRTRRGNEPLLSPESERAADEEYERRRLQSLQTRIPRPLRKAPADIHTLAYKAVRADWERWKIWDPRWGVLPGMHWMHEEPQEIFIRRRIAEENGEEWIEADEEEDDEADEHEEQEQPVPNDQRPQEDTGQSELCGMQTMEEVRQQPAGNSDLFGLGSGLFTDNRGRVQVFGSLTSPPPAVPASGSIALDPFGAPLEEADRRPLSPPLVPPRQRGQPKGRGRGRGRARAQTDRLQPTPSPRRAPSSPPRAQKSNYKAVTDVVSPPLRKTRRQQAAAEAEAREQEREREVATRFARQTKRTREIADDNNDNDNDNENNADGKAVALVPEPTPARRTRQTRTSQAAGLPAAKRRRAK